MDQKQQDKIEALREQHDDLESQRPTLGDDLVNRLQAIIKDQMHLLQNTGSGAQFHDSVEAKGDVAGRDINTYNFHTGKYQGETPATPREALRIYQEFIVYRYGHIPLSGLDRGEDDASSRSRSLALEKVYVDLDIEKMEVSAKALEEALASGKSLVPWDHSRARPDDMRPLAALEAVALNSRVVLLGNPGSGKTTFVNRLALSLAGGNWEGLSRWPKRLHDCLPIIVILRDFARWHAQHPEAPSADLLWRYLCHELDRCRLGFAKKPLETALQDGTALVFLDGLDEVPPRLRQGVLDTIQQFQESYHKTRLVVTCRVASYQQSEWRLSEERFLEFTLAPFDADKIRRFIAAWYEEMAIRWKERPERIQSLAARLTEAALQRPDLARLAPNPLLLTVMALVHTHDKVLPDHRAVLYQRTVDILLWRWERSKEGQDQEPALLAHLREAGCTAQDLLVILREQAYTAHAEGGSSDDPEQVTGIGDHVLWKALRKLHPRKDLNWAQALVELMRQRAGLLVEREPGVFTFPHRTFQEYLAGVHLAVQPNFVGRAAKLAGGGAFWREVILLAVGHKVHVEGEHELTLFLVDDLCPARQPRSQVGWRKVRLAGEALLEMGLARVQRQARGEKLLDRVRRQLTVLLEKGRLDPIERAAAGDVLGVLGDPRFDPACFYLACRYCNKPEPRYGFVRINKGPFRMGSEQGEEDAEDNEFGNDNPLEIPYDYWLGRYPVTVAQFNEFVADGGYTEKNWWRTAASKAWLEEEQATAPYDWDAQLLHLNRPVMMVTWFEAMAYCAWLGARLRAKDPCLIADGYGVRLPSEAEWEKAARDGRQVRYPWGNNAWDPQRANTESGISHCSTVGMYPQGKTPSGLHDMAGNVWEWTLSSYRKYPYDPACNDPEGDDDRVLRGGGWGELADWARCASRYHLLPQGRVVVGYGFRVAVSLANSVF